MKKWIGLLVLPLAAVVLSVLFWPSIIPVQANQGYISLSIGVPTDQDITQISDPGITYPPEIDTEKEKLAAIYNLVEQMRLEHNRQGKWAEDDWKNRAEKWYQYSDIFKIKMHVIFTEKNRLEDEIRKLAYPDEYWKIITDAAKDVAYAVMYGDRTTLKDNTTSATCDVLDQLKAVDIAKLDGKYVDPYEDFTTWAETDSGPGGSCTVTSTTVTVTNNGVESEVKVVGDYGAGHFGEFEHLVDAKHIASGSSYEYAGIWAVTNTNGYLNTMAVGMQLYYYIGGTRIYIENPAASATYMDVTNNVQYYLTVDRVGTAGTLYCYSNAARTTLVDDISITVATTTLRYCIVGYTYANGHYSNNNWVVSNLDIQEAAAAPSLAATSPSSKSFGVLVHSQTYWSDNTTLGYSPSWPLSNTQCYSTLENDGTAAGLVSANATNFTGGTALSLTDAAPGSNTVRMSLFKAGDGSTDNVTLKTGDRTFLSSMASGNTTYWEIKLEWNTSFEIDATQKTSVITFTISAL